MTPKIGIDFRTGSCANQCGTASFARPKGARGAVREYRKKTTRASQTAGVLPTKGGKSLAREYVGCGAGRGFAWPVMQNRSTANPRPYRTLSGGTVMASFHVIAGASETL
jgi:hypothetical protein